MRGITQQHKLRHIPIDKPPRLRIVVPALEIIQTCFFVIVIATIPKRVHKGDTGFSAVVYAGNTFAPCVIGTLLLYAIRKRLSRKRTIGQIRSFFQDKIMLYQLPLYTQKSESIHHQNSKHKRHIRLEQYIHYSFSYIVLVDQFANFANMNQTIQ